MSLWNSSIELMDLVDQAGRDGNAYPAVIYAYAFSVWKKPFVRKFFAHSKIVFVRSASQVPCNNWLLVWGRKTVPGRFASGIRLMRLEDGFLRSVGLGADLVRPLSWVVDLRGIYFDATQPSDLEVLLQTTEFLSEQLERAVALRCRIVGAGLTKYNVGNRHWQPPADALKIILVPGQVESDASLRYGAPGICSNLGLLRAVREANPGDYVVYKPHPDVVAGLRRKGFGEEAVSSWCDEIVVDSDMGELLQQVDEVHTLTSLAGFEALLRGKQVTCYGQPFYSGWGLTTDILPNLRRSRELTLDMLVAGTLILYPIYLSRNSDQLITPEHALEELLSWRAQASEAIPRWRVLYRFVVKNILRKP
jgi:capsular polysaccharide export protein